MFHLFISNITPACGVRSEAEHPNEALVILLEGNDWHWH